MCSVVVADTLTDQESERPRGAAAPPPQRLQGDLREAALTPQGMDLGITPAVLRVAGYTGSAQGMLVNVKQGRNTRGFWERALSGGGADELRELVEGTSAKPVSLSQAR